jgi:hypothetical protein
MTLIKIQRFLFYIICLVPFASLAQDVFYSPLYQPQKGSRLQVEGLYQFNSNALTTSFADKYFRGGFIDGTLKNQVSRRLSEENRFGGDANYGFTLFMEKKDTLIEKRDTVLERKAFQWYVGLHQREHINGAFSDDLFNLLFYGNRNFAGDTANLSGFRYERFSWKQLSAGMVFNEGRTGAGFSFLLGEQHNSIRMPRSTFYTAEDASSLSWDVNATYSQAGLEDRRAVKPNGYGASMDFFTFYPFNGSDTSRFRLLFEVRDLGFINWSDNAYSFRLDSTYSYDGFEVVNLFELKDTVLDFPISDSALKEHATNYSRNYTTMLPATIHIAQIVDLTDKFTIIGGLRYRFVRDFWLQAYMTSIYNVTEHFGLSGSVSYGGFGGVSAGLGLYHTKDDYTIALRAMSMEGYVLPDRTSGQSLHLTFIRRFR